jgi:hypothetical protein
MSNVPIAIFFLVELGVTVILLHFYSHYGEAFSVTASSRSRQDV